jgi:hypothetical protein
MKNNLNPKSDDNFPKLINIAKDVNWKLNRIDLQWYIKMFHITIERLEE